MALCFAGGHFDGDARNYIEHYFTESEVYKGRFEAQGCSVSTAFGTNTELFKPIPAQHKLFDALFPATFALWKRHNLFAEATKGLKACAVGFVYETHEQECWQVCEAAGNLVLPHVSAEALRHLYAASKCVVIPSRADGGSQRTVLEAMAMNIPVIVCGDSDKTTEYVREGGGLIVAPNAFEIREAMLKAKDLNFNTENYIKSKWSEYTYADALDKWILQ
jgi:glycosyltransferase involved in cell wall biosynthesis